MSFGLLAMEAESFEMREMDIPQHVQSLIAQKIFGANDVNQLRPYFRYYSQQCRSMSMMARMQGHQLPIATHTELIGLIEQIRQQLPHAVIREKFNTSHPGSAESLIQNSLDLALRLLLMLDVGSFEYAYTGRDTITWTSGTIRDLIGTIDIFSGRQELSCDDLKLENSFNVVNIERFAGFDVRLTTNLKDHLLVREDVKIVTIFHHATFLMHQTDQASLFPPDFVKETLQTISLLFPRGDKKVERWYRRKGTSEELDMAVFKCKPTSRHIQQYKFWRDRLVLLKEAFDDTRPRTVTQWWHDRRDGVQWWTFWIAIFFTVLFGLVQSIEGGIQVYKAYNPS